MHRVIKHFLKEKKKVILGKNFHYFLQYVVRLFIFLQHWCAFYPPFPSLEQEKKDTQLRKKVSALVACHFHCSTIMRQNMTERGSATKRQRHVMNITLLHRKITSWPVLEGESRDLAQVGRERSFEIRLNQISQYVRQKHELSLYTVA